MTLSLKSKLFASALSVGLLCSASSVFAMEDGDDRPAAPAVQAEAQEDITVIYEAREIRSMSRKNICQILWHSGMTSEEASEQFLCQEGTLIASLSPIAEGFHFSSSRTHELPKRGLYLRMLEKWIARYEAHTQGDEAHPLAKALTKARANHTRISAIPLETYRQSHPNSYIYESSLIAMRSPLEALVTLATERLASGDAYKSFELSIKSALNLEPVEGMEQSERASQLITDVNEAFGLVLANILQLAPEIKGDLSYVLTGEFGIDHDISVLKTVKALRKIRTALATLRYDEDDEGSEA